MKMNLSTRLTFIWHWLAAGFLLLFVLPSTRAYDLPLHPTQYRAVIDLANGQANFSVRFDHPPDFFTLDDVGRAADAFQFFTDTVSSDPIQSTTEGMYRSGPLGTQTVIGSYEIATRRQLTIWWPKPRSEWLPDDPIVHAALIRYGDYTLIDDTLSFSVPLGLLHDPDSSFYYGFQLYPYGGWTGFNYYGTSGQVYMLPVPEPAPATMFSAGVLLLMAASRCGRRQRRNPIMG